MSTSDKTGRNPLLLGDIMISLGSVENAEELPRLAVRSMTDLFEAGAVLMTRLEGGAIRVAAAGGGAEGLDRKSVV